MRIGIFGYGNLGKGAEFAARQNGDVSVSAIFTRRDPNTVISPGGVPVISAAAVTEYKDEIDVMICCGGSAKDLPVTTPMLARDFNVADSFDTHARIPNHFEATDRAAKEGGHVAMICVGWDPGLFSLNRLYGEAFLPDGKGYTFWGKGVSQGHSDAIRRIEGVADARQYTVPVPEAIRAVRAGEKPNLTAREMHRRECYVVAERGADRAKIERKIKEMPYYFAGYDTSVTFIDAEEMQKNHPALPHGGCVIRTGTTGDKKENTHVMEYRLRLDSNPEFTAGVLIAYARAAYRMHKRGETGCKTVFDVAPADLSPRCAEELRKELL